MTLLGRDERPISPTTSALGWVLESPLFTRSVHTVLQHSVISVFCCQLYLNAICNRMCLNSRSNCFGNGKKNEGTLPFHENPHFCVLFFWQDRPQEAIPLRAGWHFKWQPHFLADGSGAKSHSNWLFKIPKYVNKKKGGWQKELFLLLIQY